MFFNFERLSALNLEQGIYKYAFAHAKSQSDASETSLPITVEAAKCLRIFHQH